MLERMLTKMHRKQTGITGLETAIILIAFVVVASVFAYTVLSAGVFSAEKSSEAVYSGLQEAQSTLELRGGVTAYSSDCGDSPPSTAEEINLFAGAGTPTSDCDVVTRLQFTVGPVLGGEAIDLTPNYSAASTVDPPTELSAYSSEDTTMISYHDKYNHFSDCAWTIDWIGSYNDDNLLEANEKAMITVWLVNHNSNTFRLSETGGNNTWFCDDDDGASATSCGKLIGPDHTFTLEVKPATGAVLAIERTTPAHIDAVMDLH